jgi:hypothetical protein
MVAAIAFVTVIAAAAFVAVNVTTAIATVLSLLLWFTSLLLLQLSFLTLIRHSLLRLLLFAAMVAAAPMFAAAAITNSFTDTPPGHHLTLRPHPVSSELPAIPSSGSGAAEGLLDSLVSSN